MAETVRVTGKPGVPSATPVKSTTAGERLAVSPAVPTRLAAILTAQNPEVPQADPKPFWDSTLTVAVVEVSPGRMVKVPAGGVDATVTNGGVVLESNDPG